MAEDQAAERKVQVAGVFDRVAATYSRVGPPFFAHFAGRLVELAQVPRGAHVLDIATGRGAVLFPAVHQVGPTGRVTGIDLSDAMVKATTQEARERGIENVEVLKMDAEELLFPRASFDQALCGFGVFFFPRAPIALAEILRVLRPGGSFAASTWGKDDGPWERLYNLFQKHAPPPPQTEPKPPAPDFETPEGMKTLMREGGFDDIRVIHETADFVYPTKEDWWETQWSHGARRTIERIQRESGAEGIARFQGELYEHLDAMMQPDGIHHTMHVLVTIAAKPRV